MSASVQRKLTTILAADAEGYSRAMETDEVRALGALRAAREVFGKFIERHGGRVANTAGDSLIAEFPSVVEAVQCAVEVQRELGGAEDALRFRIGVHLGDVMIEGDDLLGEGVNLAARLQTMAEPGGILISQQVYDQVRTKLSVRFDYLGDRRPKNFTEPVAVYRVELADGERGAVHEARQAPPRGRPAHDAPRPGGLKQRVIRRASLLGAIWIVLLAIDLATGGPFWAHWPGLGLATLAALDATPLIVSGRLSLQIARGAVIVGALALINLFTWTGYPWFLWPAAALLIIELVRRLGARVR